MQGKIQWLNTFEEGIFGFNFSGVRLDDTAMHFLIEIFIYKFIARV